MQNVALGIGQLRYLYDGTKNNQGKRRRHLRHLNNELSDAVGAFRDCHQDDRPLAEEGDGGVGAVDGPDRVAEVVDVLDVSLHHGHERRQLVLVAVPAVDRLPGLGQDEEVLRLTPPCHVVTGRGLFGNKFQ